MPRNRTIESYDMYQFTFNETDSPFSNVIPIYILTDVSELQLLHSSNICQCRSL